MKTAKILSIFILALIAILCQAKISNAASMGTAFTYQGRLIDTNVTADGLYDFQFKLFDANVAGSQLGTDVNTPEVDVIDGYFTVELDFGAVFEGSQRWLEIGVRPGELEDPNGYTILSPRQDVTPTPYALYAETAGSSSADSDWIISGNDMYSGVSGNVGIGTTSPLAKLHVDSEGNTELRIEHDDVKNLISFYRSTHRTGHIEKDDDAGLLNISADGSTNHISIDATSGNVSIGETPIADSNLFVARPTGNYGAGRSTIYAYREGLNNDPNGGTNWGRLGVDAAIKAFSNWGNSYSAGIAGYGYLDYPESAAVIGALHSAALRGMLAYRDENNSLWAGYFDGKGYFSGNVGIGTTSPASKLDVSGDSRLSGNVAIGTSPSTTYQLRVSADETTPFAGYFITYDNEGNGTGVCGSAYGNSGTNHFGLYGTAYDASTNYGVYGYANGTGTNYGIYGNAGGGTSNWAGYFNGNVYTGGNLGIGTTPNSKLSIGDSGSSSYNLYVGTYNIYGIYTTDSFYGLYSSGTAQGIWASCYDDSGSNTGLYAVGGSNGTNDAKAISARVFRDGSGTYYSGYFIDSGSGGTYNGLYADVRTGGAIDLAEYILDTIGDTEAGDVLVADPHNKESVLKSSTPYDTSVVGVVSTQPHLLMGMELVMDEESGEMYEGVNATMLALAGRVPTKVTDENGPVRIGDLLTTSSKPGYAMKWTALDVTQAQDFEELKQILSENQRRQNAIVGRALESLNGGEGKIMALINSR
jgi:hypothetical protein